MKIIILFFPFFLFANDLEQCYQNGDQSCGFELAKQYETENKIEEAGNIYLDLSLHDETGESSLALGKLFIYKMEQNKENCRKGVSYMLNSLQGNKPNINTFLELSILFKNGVCVEKDLTKSEKYANSYKKLKGE
jgi:hypothetical protein